ncbi:uncharacterized protein BX664DRAFT_377543 [Halteromyces radiatus]|uniref:uncharacterized protein n=1 Tax=Halteromyces radiatus TaxID=101107 RepID=UPI00221EEA18|nr:uncharacterized protein BX664DRAFT_377543 [Halteromyces radiatus]KAI8099899.1 hypothetical protein BX664DRAFT_377543 [Halteromyces radiatus]
MSRLSILFLLAICLLSIVSGQMDAKTKKLIQLAKENNGVVKLDSNAYFKYTQGKREYGMVILLTALGDQFRCVPCREFDPEYKLVASSFRKGKEPNKVFFGHLDFQDGQAVYQQLALQTAPNVLYFPPSDASDKKDAIKYDLARNGFSAEPLAEFIKNQSGISFNVVRPFDYGLFLAKVILGLGALAILKLVYRYFSFILFHKNTWTAATILTVLVMTSGHMFNRIRNTPYSLPGPNGQLSYVASGFSTQYGIETQIVAAMYGVLAFAVVNLAITIPNFDDKWRQRAGVYIWVSCFIVVFSCLMALFKIKNEAYPFKILF